MSNALSQQSLKHGHASGAAPVQPRQDLISEPNDEEETQSASGVIQLDQS